MLEKNTLNQTQDEFVQEYTDKFGIILAALDRLVDEQRIVDIKEFVEVYIKDIDKKVKFNITSPDDVIYSILRGIAAMCIDDGVPILTFLIRPANFLSVKAFDSFSLSYVHRYFNQKPEVWDDESYEGGQVDGWWDTLSKRDKEQKYSQVLQDIFSFDWSAYQDELSNSGLQGFFILNITSENFDYSKYYKNKQSPSFSIPYFKVVQEIISNEEILSFVSEQDDWSLIEEKLSDIITKYSLTNKINELKIIINFVILKQGDIIALPVDAKAGLFLIAEVLSDDALSSEENVCSKNIKILKEINIQRLSFEKECKSFFCEEIYEDRAIELIKLIQEGGVDLGYEFEA